jgi:poly-gamma-glutamate synthesis protein (capsule biosynthesis protein)
MKKHPAKALLCSGALPPFLFAGVLALAASLEGRSQTAGKDPLPPDATWSLAAAGDSIMTRQVQAFESDPAFMALVKQIRAADAAVINLEVQLFRLWEFKGYPQVENGGNYELGPPEVAADMKWMGFDMFNTANNHTTDYGVEGMMETMRLLDSLKLVWAGTGMTAGEAAQAHYFETAKGRFALIGMATSFTPMARAGDARPEVKGRPGLNALRIDHATQLAPAQMAALRKLVQESGGALGGRGGGGGDPESRPVRIEGTVFVPGPENRIVYTINPQDEERILRSIRNAARQADHVVVYSHSHDISGSGANTAAPAHLREMIKKCLDAGADTFVISGPHVLRGLEVYNGKPIFYSLGDFIMQNETIEPVPGEMFEAAGLPTTAQAGDYYDSRAKPDPKTGFPTAYHPANPAVWQSVLPVAVFKGHTVTEIKFYPVDMGFRVPRPHQGTPRLADAALGKEILEGFGRMSEVYGAKITIEDGVGVWRAEAAAPR